MKEELEKIYKFAEMMYKEGYEECKKELARERESEYQRGLNDALGGKTSVKKAYDAGLNAAWECARKIAQLNKSEQNTLFGVENPYPSQQTLEIFKNFSAAEAIKKIKEYESHVPEKDVGEIKVGDEVTLCGQIGVVSEEPHKIGHNQLLFARVWFAVGSSSTINVESLKKTGKHYPEIAEVLRMMKNESN